MKKKRVIGTTNEAIKEEEILLERKLPSSFKLWLLQNNGLDLADVHIYPVRDERDVRKTWESLSHNFNNGWASWMETFEGEDIEFPHLLPFADFGTGDYYCFDYSNEDLHSEVPVVIWCHETGETEYRASDFEEFAEKVRSREFRYD